MRATGVPRPGLDACARREASRGHQSAAGAPWLYTAQSEAEQLDLDGRPLVLRGAVPESFEAGVVASGFDKLPIAFSHAEAVASLPPHHNDPFDRMLVAQARCEHLTLITHDRRFAAYGIEIAWT